MSLIICAKLQYSASSLNGLFIAFYSQKQENYCQLVFIRSILALAKPSRALVVSLILYTAKLP